MCVFTQPWKQFSAFGGLLRRMETCFKTPHGILWSSLPFGTLAHIDLLILSEASVYEAFSCFVLFLFACFSGIQTNLRDSQGRTALEILREHSAPKAQQITAVIQGEMRTRVFICSHLKWSFRLLKATFAWPHRPPRRVGLFASVTVKSGDVSAAANGS